MTAIKQQPQQQPQKMELSVDHYKKMVNMLSQEIGMLRTEILSLNLILSETQQHNLAISEHMRNIYKENQSQGDGSDQPQAEDAAK